MRITIKIVCLFLLMGITGGSLLAQQKKRTKKVVKKATPKPVVKKNTLPADAPANYSTTQTNTDTVGTKTVIITSAFKPSLQNAAKINFSAASIVADSSKLALTYKVPSSNLSFYYLPVPIKPLAMPADSGMAWVNNHRVKLGAGNLNSVFAEGRFSFGDGKKSITTLQGNFISSKGKRFAQQYNRFGLDVLSILNTRNDLEYTTHAFFTSTTQYRYGFEPNTLVFAKDQLQLIYNTVGAEVGLTNRKPNEAGINFHPKLSFYRFSNNSGNGENNLVFKAPIEKVFGKIFSFKLTGLADIAKLSATSGNINNQLFSINPAIMFTTPNVKLNVGILPSWDNGQYIMLPDLSAEGKLPNTKLSVEVGWVGHFNKNSYRTLATYNPWIASLTTIANTRVTEQYVGIKGGTLNHLSFNTKLAFVQLKNQPLFLNSAGDGKSFITIFEPSMQVMKLSGEINYAFQEKFSLLASTVISRFSNISTQAEAWGLIPFEVTAGLQWKPFSDFQVKSDFFYRNGSLYRDPSMATKRLSAAIDVNLGVEFGVLPKLNVWLQMNNLFNNFYQRWNQYPVFGFNVMGGVVYSFQ